MDHSTKRSVFLSNWISLILTLVVFFQYFNRNFIFEEIKGGVGLDLTFTLIGIPLFLLPILLNRFGWINISRLLICWLPVLFIWTLGLSMIENLEQVEASTYISMRIFVLIFTIIPYFLFNRENLPYLAFSVLPTFLSILLFDQIMEFFGHGPKENGIWIGEYPLMTMRTLTAYIILSLASFTFQDIILAGDRFNSRLYKVLQSKKEEILFKNEELHQSHGILDRMNQSLEGIVEQKTKDLRRKNEMLIRYAHANAHDIRGPVARILGLIKLMDMEEKVDYEWFFRKIENEMEDIDRTLKRISRELNEDYEEGNAREEIDENKTTTENL